jgi:Zn-dependent protease
MAFLATPLMLLSTKLAVSSVAGLISSTPSFGSKMDLALLLFLTYFVRINIMFGIFNLLPIPPLDGSRILLVFLPQKAYYFVVKYELYIKLALMAILFTGLLDDPLNFLENGVLTCFVGFWSLIPGL